MDNSDVTTLRDNLGLTQEELAKKIGVSRNTIINYEKGGVIPESKIQLLQSLLEVSILNIGVESIEKKSNKIIATEAKTGKTIIGAATPTYIEPQYTVPLLPVSAAGGQLNDFVTSVMLSECEQIISPIRGAELAIPVSGGSMSPEYPSGATVLIKKVNERAFIEWGKVYVLDTCNGVVVKEIHRSIKPETIECHSINPDPKYAPFEVQFSDIYGMYRVLMCMSTK